MKIPVIPDSCAVFGRDLKAYLDGEVSAPRRLIIRAHLRRCEACRREVQLMENINRELQNENAPAFGDALRQRILDKLPPQMANAPLESAAQNVRANPAWRGAGRYVVAGGLTVLVVAAALPVLNPPARENARKIQVSDAAREEKVAQKMPANPPVAGAAAAKAPPLAIEKAAPQAHIDGANFKFEDGHVKWLRGNAEATDEFSNKLKSANESQPQSGIGGKVTFSLLNEDGSVAVQRTLDQKRLAQIPRGESRAASRGKMAEAPLRDASILRRVHREARITVGVDDIEAQSDAAEQAVRGAGGYIVSNNLSTGSDNRKTATLDVRVPVAQFETVIREISHLGDVRAKNVSGRDITEEYSDAQEAHNVLGSDLSVREAQLKKALADAEKAAKRRGAAVSDPWQLRAEVRRLRIEAAQVRARLEILRKLSDFSQITIELTEKSVKPTGGFSQEMGGTLHEAGETFAAAARLPLKFAVWVLAFAPLWLPALLFYRWLFPRKSVATLGQTPEAPPA